MCSSGTRRIQSGASVTPRRSGRRSNRKYREFSKAAGLPEQWERAKAYVLADLTDIDIFSPLKEYDGEIKVIEKFSLHY